MFGQQFLKIGTEAGWIGSFWWINADDEIEDVSDNPWSTLLARRVGSCGFGLPVRMKYEALSESEMEGILK